MVLVLLLSITLESQSASAATEVSIFIYAAYGSPQKLHVSGRVIEKSSQRQPKKEDSAVRNLWRTLCDLESDEAPGVSLVVKFQSLEVKSMTDEEGLFSVTLKALPADPFRSPNDSRMTIAVDPSQTKFTGDESSTVPPILGPEGLAIVSDIDDTIVDSQVTRKASLLSRTFLENAASVSPVPGMARLYRDLQQRSVEDHGPRTTDHGPTLAASGGLTTHHSPLTTSLPIFYLSGSPINLYARLRFYLELHKFPSGPLFLKKLGTGEQDDSFFEQKTYKLKHLRRLAQELPGTRFLLFGDSGESDPDIYTTFRKEHPDRVVAIFIRRVDTTPKSERIPDDVWRIEDSFDAARRLTEMGLLSQEKALDVGKEVWGENPIPEELLRHFQKP